MSKKDLLKGGADRDVRNVNIIIDIAKELELIPPASKIIKVTGSKGKGTTTRLINHYMQSNFPNQDIAMLVSPEELEHTDRMKINNTEISKEVFVTIALEILEYLQSRVDRLQKEEYFSPSGIFLLIALSWFKKQNVDYYILELGRGAKYDEVGQIFSKVSVVTSILEEHLNYLGPTLKDIALNKLYVTETSHSVILGPIASAVNRAYHIVEERPRLIDVVYERTSYDKPLWYLIDEAIAKRALEEFCRDIEHKSLLFDDTECVSESFAMFIYKGKRVIYEPLVSKSSIDQEYITYLQKEYGSMKVIASLPDDKDLYNICSYFQEKGIGLKHITLRGTRGYLEYALTEKNYKKDILKNLDFKDFEGAKRVVEELLDSQEKTLYFLGTHTYIRLIKLALSSSLKPNSNLIS